MKRHPSLVPLSHDHHHALVEARRLRRAAAGDDAERRTALAHFLRFFATETVRHFREEEEQLFPALAGHEGDGETLLVQALLEHQRLHALTGGLARALAAGEADGPSMRELAELLEAHVRLEERRLFPLIQEIVPHEELNELELARPGIADGSPVVDLLGGDGAGPLWGTATDDLNATLLAWPPDGGTDEHVNGERDVFVVVLSGSATVTVDGKKHELGPSQALIVEKGRRRRIAAGPAGVRYLSVHRRRGGLQIAARGVTRPTP